MQKKIYYTIILFTIAFCFAFCNKANDDEQTSQAIVGHWNGEYHPDAGASFQYFSIDMKADGTLITHFESVSGSMYPGTYKVENRNSFSGVYSYTSPSTEKDTLQAEISTNATGDSLILNKGKWHNTTGKNGSFILKKKVSN